MSQNPQNQQLFESDLHSCQVFLNKHVSQLNVKFNEGLVVLQSPALMQTLIKVLQE